METPSSTDDEVGEICCGKPTLSISPYASVGEWVAHG